MDGALETTIVASFSRVGYLVRRRSPSWTSSRPMDGRTVLVTGASSGIGRASAIGLAQLGATVLLTGRDEQRTRAVEASIVRAGGQARASLLDLSDPSAIDGFASQLRDELGRLDGLVHAAGALSRSFAENVEGMELTVATHVLGPFRLSWRLAPLLARADGAVIVTVASGGMYTERFDLPSLVMNRDEYQGVRAYARSKRAQVLLAHEWQRRWQRDGVSSFVMHPGWTDTPGLAQSLPNFHRLGPLLRRPEEGADTVVWLASGAANEDTVRDSGIWLDRRRRSEYYLPWTRPRTSALEDGVQLWAWCEQRTGLGPTDQPR